jgi:hypothetical protein
MDRKKWTNGLAHLVSRLKAITLLSVELHEVKSVYADKPAVRH